MSDVDAIVFAILGGAIILMVPLTVSMLILGEIRDELRKPDGLKGRRP